MKSFIYGITFAALYTTAALAQSTSLMDRMAAASAQNAISADIAAGEPGKAAFDVIVPALQQQTAGKISLTAQQTTGSDMSVTAVCSGLAPLAITQGDVFRLHTGCQHVVRDVGRPVSWYTAFMVVRSDTEYNYVHKWVKHVKDGQRIKVAIGAEGSGGAITFHNLLEHEPKWAAAIEVSNDGFDTALPFLQTGGVDAIFFMDAPSSPRLKRMAGMLDKNGNKLFKLENIEPDDEFFAQQTDNGHALYTYLELPAAAMNDVYSFGTPALLIAEGQWLNQHHAAAQVLTAAMENASSTVYRQTLTPADWREKQ